MVRDGSAEMHGGVGECIFTYTLARLYIGPCRPYIDDEDVMRSQKQVETVVVGRLTWAHWNHTGK